MGRPAKGGGPPEVQLLHLGAAGNVHTTTVRAFTAAEMDKILANVQVG